MRGSSLKQLAIFVVTGFVLLLAGGVQAQEADAAAILQKWMNSAHGDATAEAFIHWDSDGEIPPSCAGCHSGEGFRDRIGVDGTPGIDHPIATGSLIDCETCHNPTAMALASVEFPSGVTIEGIEKNATCMSCHLGRESGESVKMSVGDMDEDTVNPELGFINVHYTVAAATKYGSEVHGAFEYEGKTYMGEFAHVPGFSFCSDCHDQHALTVKVENCATCHKTEEVADIRLTTMTDVDGDGDVTEGIAHEVDALHEMLGAAIVKYSADVSDAPIIYGKGSYPYWFADTNGNGEPDADELERSNGYKSWTPRLLKAAYNYHFVLEDPGAFAHNPHYALQILYDSIENLSEKVDMDISGLTRP